MSTPTPIFWMVPMADLVWRTERSSSKFLVLRADTCTPFSDKPLVGSALVAGVAAGLAGVGGVLDNEPGIPIASLKVLRSSTKSSERVLGPLSRAS